MSLLSRTRHRPREWLPTADRWAGDEADLGRSEQILPDSEAPLGGAIVAIVYGMVAWVVLLAAAFAIYRLVTIFA